MRLFLSWSGPRGRAVAHALGAWLPKLVAGVEPWISSDIEKGARWATELSKELEGVDLGIICLTRDSIAAPWVLFEAGALTKSRQGSACTFLLDMEPAQVEWPLAQFQHTVARKADVRRLVGTINRAVHDAGKPSVGARDLDEAFDILWPELDAALKQIPTINVPPDLLDGKNDEWVARHALVTFQAEDLMGKLSAAAPDEDASNGRCRYAILQGQRDHIVYGPYEPLATLGAYVAFYKIKIGPETPDGPILYLDVIGGGFADRQLHRASFPTAGAYYSFAVRFQVRSSENIEYRVLPMTQTGEFWVDHIAVVQASDLRQ